MTNAAFVIAGTKFMLLKYTVQSNPVPHLARHLRGEQIDQKQSF
jgi:hypothetical protein